MRIRALKNRWSLVVVTSKTGNQRGDALAVAILYVAVLLTVLLGVHVVIISMSRTSVQSAANAAVAAAQAAGPAIDGGCLVETGVTGSARQCEALNAAALAFEGARGAVVPHRTPVVAVDAEAGVVHVIAYGQTVSPVFGRMTMRASACGPLDDVPVSQLTAAETWQC